MAKSGWDSLMGLSPPTRGSPLRHIDQPVYLGSIPAHAGEPCTVRWWTRVTRVYPRPRGGAAKSDGHCPSLFGLSPPTRGSRIRRFRQRHLDGSIPAHAGEPVRRQAG